mgnify:CR=1 FL=1
MRADRSFSLGRRITRFLSTVSTVVLALGATGCAGARTQLVADRAAYPISLSRAVRDADGSLVPHERMAKVGTLKHEATAWGMLYSAVELTPRTEISDAVNRQTAAAGGDAVVNLRVMTRHCGADWMALFTAIPFWPGCMEIVVEGDIVKVRPVASARGARLASYWGVRMDNLEAVR